MQKEVDKKKKNYNIKLGFFLVGLGIIAIIALTVWKGIYEDNLTFSTIQWITTRLFSCSFYIFALGIAYFIPLPFLIQKPWIRLLIRLCIAYPLSYLLMILIFIIAMILGGY